MLELLLAPEEDSADMALALCCVDPQDGVTVLGHAVAWGYDDGLPPLLAATRCSHPMRMISLCFSMTTKIFTHSRRSAVPCLSGSHCGRGMLCCSSYSMSLSLVLFSSPTLLDAAYLARNVDLSESWCPLTGLRSLPEGQDRDRHHRIRDLNSEGHAANAGGTS